MTTKHCIIILFCFALSFIETANAQSVTLLNPSNITYRGISMGDKTHSMCVGDSASIVLNTSSNDWGSWTSKTLSPPCDRIHTFYGVSYYTTTHAAIVGDGGLIFFTPDRGTTWKQSAAGITGQTLRGITHTSNGTFLIVGDSGIVIRSADSGVSWTKITSSTILAINAISIGADGRGYFVGEHGLIGTTTDYGLTWPNVSDTTALGYKSASPVTLRSVAISRGDTAIVVGDKGAVGMTQNGTTWVALPVSISAGSNFAESFLPRISFSGVTFTGDGWTLISEADILASITLGVDMLVLSNSYMLAGDADGGTDFLAWRYDCGTYNYVTSQAGGAFESVFMNSNILPSYFENFLFASIDSLGNGFATCTGGAFLKTADNGYSWIQGVVNSNNKATDIHTIDATHAFAMGWAGTLFRTSNGGTSWDKSIIDPNLERLHSIAHPASNVFVVSGDNGTILRSVDDALTWKPSNVQITTFLEAVAFSSADTGITVGTNGTILRTTDQGLTWNDVKNPLTGTAISYRKLVAFHSGIYYATTDSSGLFTSSDNGENWNAVTNAPNTIGLAFYNERIGVIAESAWSSALVPDTMRFAFTRDGFATKPIEFNIPIINNNRMTFHFLDSNSFLCFGSYGFVVKVEMSASGVHITSLSAQTSLIQAYPNPSTSHSTTIAYDLDHSGETKIELWNILGERVQTFFAGNQEIGHHSQELKMSASMHGAFFIKVISADKSKTVPIVVE